MNEDSHLEMLYEDRTSSFGLDYEDESFDWSQFTDEELGFDDE